MCLPSSLLKAGSQLLSSRDSTEAKGPLGHIKAELHWPQAWQGLCTSAMMWGGEQGSLEEFEGGPPPLSDFSAAQKALTAEGSSRKAGTEQLHSPQ